MAKDDRDKPQKTRRDDEGDPPESMAEATSALTDGRFDLKQTARVALQRSQAVETPNLPLFIAIRESTEALSFSELQTFLAGIMCGGARTAIATALALPFTGVEPYRLLKAAVEVFVMTRCGVVGKTFGEATFDINDPDIAADLRRLNLSLTSDELKSLWNSSLVKVSRNPIGSSAPPADVLTIPILALIRNRLGLSPLESERVNERDRLAEVCFGILERRLTRPCMLELIWSYWHEEGMLVQTLNAVSLRFQNKRTDFYRDPLKRFDIDPLRGLNSLLWGYIQDEQHRLSVVRRAYEYDHHYGLSLYGKAIPVMRTADSRSKFLEAFHNILYLTAMFYRQDDDLTIQADAFPLLNGLREVNILLAEGMHNQFGDLPSTSRIEMLIEQWLLAREEMREFLGGRISVPYTEDWMDRVDTMKTLQGWSDVSVTHFHDLAVFGEQILLSIRYGGWTLIEDPAEAANWARILRPQIQRYIHSYRAVTGVDLAAGFRDGRRAAERNVQPSVLLRNRLAMQRQIQPDGSIQLGPGDYRVLSSGDQPATQGLERSRLTARKQLR